jgi:NAD(P) transhydrogenase subunit alpha
MTFEMILIVVTSMFVGFLLINSVTHALHAPLMSLTNAVSSIIIISAIYQYNDNDSQLTQYLCLGAITIASINIFGAFAITHRMLKMFKIRSKKEVL